MTSRCRPGRSARPGPVFGRVSASLRAAALLCLAAAPGFASDAARKAAVLAPPADFSVPEAFEGRPGGAATSFAPPDRRALRHPFPTLDPDARFDAALGEAVFEKLWVAAPSSTKSSDGLGPLHDARSCSGCHLRSARGVGLRGVSLRLVPADPVYGDQLQRRAVAGVPAEGRLKIDWETRKVALGDGETVSLRRPVPRISALAHGPLAPGVALSLRVAPPLIGLGLLEAIPEADIRAAADPDDRNGDGISGRANEGDGLLARFGVRAEAVSVAAQTASAFRLDMGLSTPPRPGPAGDCTEAQAACRGAPHGGDDGPEVGAELLRLTSLYTASLAPPARHDPGAATVLRGKRLFHAAGCAACHTPKFVTARLPEDPARSFQLIWPYSDLLLHDMGAGLADASGAEWRTAPLWGVGLAQVVAPEAGFLHDGRARSLLEAVLWHGGEAEPAREAVRLAPKPDRDALIAFLESL